MRQRINVLTRVTQSRAEEEAAAERDPLVQLCAFFVGTEEYAVDIMRVEEILQPQRLTPLRGSPPFIEGVIRLRGAILPVVDLRKRLLGQPSPVDTPKTRLLVCWLGRRRVAFTVDRVSEVVRLRRSDIKPALGAVGSAPFVVGVYGAPEGRDASAPGGERLKLLLDVKALLLAEMLAESNSNPNRRVNG
ncbi:Positive regulator of CheA protein activity (CheW) [Cystobacter fuscus]|uniref:Positive regulator of CheA protein activity (CheW) n=1 Tax=Cystobacter fuscus TaxID=43 RepID=A0A250J253_9BACT|nr:chemotaxis protein CheW [Cystobacter fuscus]ATB38064.1 Positive regulator of CheA protein activity (CheW) [Cystobacter fuscus]